MADRILMTVGTKKGVFVAESSARRNRFTLRGPFGQGVGVYTTMIDTRSTPRVYASSCNPFFGMKLLCSTDLGKKFRETKSAPAFPEKDGRAMANIWSLEPGDSKKELLLCACVILKPRNEMKDLRQSTRDSSVASFLRMTTG